MKFGFLVERRFCPHIRRPQKLVWSYTRDKQILGCSDCRKEWSK